MANFASVTKSISTLGLLGLLFLMPGCGRQSGQADAAQTEKDLRALQDEWAVARMKGDVDFLERFYAQELRLQVMDGSVVERKTISPCLTGSGVETRTPSSQNSFKTWT